MLEIKIPKEIRKHKESIFFGLSARQFVCAVLAVAIAVVVYLIGTRYIGKETSSWLCILLAAPVGVAGFFQYNGMTLEQYVFALFKSEFLYAGTRKFVARNYHYEAMNRKEKDDYD